MDEARILDVWSQGRTRPGSRRLLLLAAAYPDRTPEELARLSVGRCNALLLQDRMATFGCRFDGETCCPGCGERLEISLEFEELLGSDDPGEEPADVACHLRIGDAVLPFRLPTVGDIEQAAACPDADSAVRVLLRACLTVDEHGSRHGPAPDTITEASLLQALDIELRRRDVHADLRIRTDCPDCGVTFEAALDPASLYWEELEDRARQLLIDVHRLAVAYGWSERESLGLDPVRRAGYLELIG